MNKKPVYYTEVIKCKEILVIQQVFGAKWKIKSIINRAFHRKQRPKPNKFGGTSRNNQTEKKSLSSNLFKNEAKKSTLISIVFNMLGALLLTLATC